MADLSVNFAGIHSPNPFWLASAPPTNTGYQVMRAFEAGWGGAVWKTLGDPTVNVTSRFGGLSHGGQKMVGFNNIELITDRPLEDNLKEIKEVKYHFPERSLIASLMMEHNRQRWQDLVKQVQDVGVDGFELNFGCPHGMAERGMGSAVGQHTDLIAQQVEWVMEASEIPVIVKLTPNITDIRYPAISAVKAGCSAISMINTINSLIGVDLQTWNPIPHVDGKGSHGGYCGPAVKPIALHMVADCARDPRITVPISGIGGISNWRDAVEFILMGATNVQVCTAVMHHGFRIIEELIDGLNNYLDSMGIALLSDIIGKSVNKYVEWSNLNIDYNVVAKIEQDKCIHCNKCYISCEDAAHQAIELVPLSGVKNYSHTLLVNKDKCVGCNLCYEVCPVEGCIQMLEVDSITKINHAKTHKVSCQLN